MLSAVRRAGAAESVRPSWRQEADAAEQVSAEKRLVFLDAIAALDARMVPVPKAPWWFG